MTPSRSEAFNNDVLVLATWFGRVLQLYGNPNMTGPLPSSVFELTSLSVLSLADNAYTGSIPSAIGGLTNLVDLDLSGNLLQSSIPSSIGALVQLTCV